MTHEIDVDAFYAEVIEKYNRYLNPGLARLMAFAGFGVEMRSEGCYIYDHEGRKFLDMLGGYGVFSFGHSNKQVIQAVKMQLDEISLSGRAFFSKNQADLAEKLTSIAPEGLQYTFFCNSGAEAVEAALKLAKGATGRPKIVSTDGSYHGKTLSALSTTGREKYRKPFLPLMPGVEFIPFGDAAAAVAAIDGQTAAMIIEPIQGEGGIIIPPDGYLRALREACDKHGALLIADEVQTGFGRTGYRFGVDYEGVVPDLMTLAKALGGGIMPLGCVMGTADIWDKTFGTNPLIHTSTFGGSPLACAAGLAAIDFMLENKLEIRSRELGRVFLEGMIDIQRDFPDLIGSVRGRGLMIGAEFTMDEVGELVVSQLLKRGVCVAYALNNPRVLRFEPPLIISEEEIHYGLNALREAVGETSDLLATLV